MTRPRVRTRGCGQPNFSESTWPINLCAAPADVDRGPYHIHITYSSPNSYYSIKSTEIEKNSRKKKFIFA